MLVRFFAVVCLLSAVLMSAVFADDTNQSTSNSQQQSASNNSEQQTKAPSSGTITPKQPIYTLHLNSNPTTGYSWFLVSYPKDFLQLVKHKYMAPNSNMPGAGGYEIWQFKANQATFNAPRVMKVRLMYARPWEVNDQTPVQTFYVVAKSQ